MNRFFRSQVNFSMSRQRIWSFAISLSMLASVGLLLWLQEFSGKVLPEQVVVREITLASPPPPPPTPPVVQQQVTNTALVLDVPGSGVAIELSHSDITLAIKAPELAEINLENKQWQSLEVNWDAFSLNDLDDVPTLLTALRVNFPKSLTRQGIHRVLVKVEVLIDEQGRASLINIVENPYVELAGEIRRLVRESRFTAPKKNDQVVRARFIWPIEIRS